jgi:hypothetical protein
MMLNIPLEICAAAALSPNGRGVESLAQKGECHRDQLKLISDWNKSVSVFRVNQGEPELLKLKAEPRLRRANPIGLFMADCVSQILKAHPVDSKELGIIAAFSTGALSYSHRFYKEILTQGQRFASPILFPETVFNSPTSHVAALFNISGPSYSILGDQGAWSSALNIAACWLALEEVRHVIVLGTEELDLASIEAYKHAGWFKTNREFVPSEGCGALLLRRPQTADLPKILGVSDGFTYRNKKGAERAAQQSLEPFKSYSRVVKTSSTNWFKSIEERLHEKNSFHSLELNHSGGEAFCASAAWNTIQALPFLNDSKDPVVLPIWGINHQCTALLLGKT